MLIAEIRRKLASLDELDADDPESLDQLRGLLRESQEDLLTADVFGALKYLPRRPYLETMLATLVERNPTSRGSRPPRFRVGARRLHATDYLAALADSDELPAAARQLLAEHRRRVLWISWETIHVSLQQAHRRRCQQTDSAEADYVGSLVVDGRTGRPTEYVGSRVESPDWWDTFWQRHFANTGQSRVEAMEMLRGLLGEDWARTTLARVEAAIRADSRKGPR